MTRRARFRGSRLAPLTVLVVAVGLSTTVLETAHGSTATSPSRSPFAIVATSGGGSTALVAPAASVTAEGTYLSDVTIVDPKLVTYEKREGNVALRSLLTDGTAFCGFLRRDRNIDEALVAVALGARHVESQTHLPLSVTTFNSVEAVALLTLCPSLVTTVPPADQKRITELGASLATASS